MKNILLIIFLFSTCATFAQVEYEGLGILKVKQGDHVLINADSAYLINQGIFVLGISALDYVQYNKSDSIIQVYEAERLALNNQLNQKSNLLDAALLENRKLIAKQQIEVEKLKSNSKQQEDKLTIIEYQNSEMKSKLEPQSRKTKIRTGILAVVGSVAAYFCVDKLVN